MITNDRFIITREARIAWLIMTVTVWLSFVASVWAAVLLGSPAFGWFGLFWFMWLVILIVMPGAKKKR